VCSIKKKLISLAVALVFIWLVVSAYFYGQHYIVMKDYPLYAKVDTGDAVIIISNVRVYGFERSGYFFDQQWYWSIADKIKNPNIQYPFLKICFFYTRPYIFDKDERTIQLQGLIAFKDFKGDDYESIPEEMPEIDIYGDYDVCLADGIGYHHEGSSNIHFFWSQGDDVVLKNNHTYKVVIKDHETGELIKEIPFRPEWQVHTYNFFQKKPEHLSYRPKFEVESFLSLLKNSKTETAESYIHFERSDQFPWKNLSHDYLQSVRLHSEFYIGSYLGYEDVFAIDLLYDDPDKKRRTPSEEFGKQTIYFIADKFGDWKLIDVTPLKFISRR